MLFNKKVKEENKKFMVSWFHIPVADLDRAIVFYELVFNIKMDRKKIGDQELAFFPAMGNGNMKGALVLNKTHKPSDNGTAVYFSVNSPDMEPEIFRVETGRGEIISHKTFINNEMGYIAWVTDPEGNKFALLSKH